MRLLPFAAASVGVSLVVGLAAAIGLAVALRGSFEQTIWSFPYDPGVAERLGEALVDRVAGGVRGFRGVGAVVAHGSSAGSIARETRAGDARPLQGIFRAAQVFPQENQENPVSQVRMSRIRRTSVSRSVSELTVCSATMRRRQARNSARALP